MKLLIPKLVIDCNSLVYEKENDRWLIVWANCPFWIRLLFLFTGQVLMSLENAQKLNFKAHENTTNS